MILNILRTPTILLLFLASMTSFAADNLPLSLRTIYALPTLSSSAEINSRMNILIAEKIQERELKVIRKSDVFQYLKSRSRYTDAIRAAVFKKINTELVLGVEVNQTKDQLSFMSMQVHDKDLKIIFKKVSQQSLNQDEASDLVLDWLSEFLEQFPITGQVQNIDGDELTMYFPKGIDLGKLKEKHFQVYCRSSECNSINSRDARGVFHSIDFKQRIVKGHLYNTTPYLRGNPNLSKLDVVHINVATTKYDKNVDVVTKDLTATYQYKNSLRACATLPFLGNLPAKRMAKIRSLFLNQLDNDGRCINKNNEEFLNILGKYKKNIDSYLEDPQVLSLIATKLKIGSLFAIDISQRLMGTRLVMKVIGENGRDIFFHRQTILDDANNQLISNLLYQWLLQYVKSMPYDAFVIEAVDDNVLFDLGVKAFHKNKQYFQVWRPTKITLFKEGEERRVKWEKKLLASGTVTKASDKGSVGLVLKKEHETIQLKRGDWVELTNYNRLGDIKNTYFTQHNIKNKRNYGRWKAGANLLRIGGSSGDKNQSKNFTSLSLGLDLFLPLGWLALFEAERHFDDLGQFDIKTSNFRGAAGYSKVIDGNRFISLIDVFAGLMTAYAPLDHIGETGVGNLSYTGPYAGVRFEMPIYEKVKTYGGIWFSPFLSGENDDPRNLLPVEGNTTYMSLFGTIDYRFTKNLAYYAELHFERFKTDLMDSSNGDIIDLSFNTTKVRFGIFLNF